MIFQRTTPVDFKFASWLMSKDVPGSWSLYKRLITKKYADLALAYPLSDDGRIYMPAGWPRLYEPDILVSYEQNAIREFSSAIDQIDGSTILVDCGADVGAFSRLVLLHTQRIGKVYAIEPNVSSFSVLKRNFDFVPKPTECFQGGAAKQSGRGSLMSPKPDAHSHTFFIDPDDTTGDIPLITIDELVSERNCPVAIKIDVEGLELDVLQGATDLLKSATSFVVQFEAHPEVAVRSGIDPMDCIRLLDSIRPCRFTGWSDTLENKLDIDPSDKAFFDKADPAQIYNVIVVPKE